MDGSSHIGRVKIFVVGQFRVQSQDSEDLTPRGRKACGLLALLALSPTRSRSRAVLQDKLWSDRAPEQGSSSLRQALSEVRKSLGPYRECLQSDLRAVSLDSNRVDVDLEALNLAELALERSHDLPQLLEDLDIRDAEFEHWLRDQRTAFNQRLEALATGNRAIASGQATADAASTNLTERGVRPWVRILPPSTPCGESGAFIAQLVGETIARGISERSAAEVCEKANGMVGLELRVEALHLPRVTCVHVTLFHGRTKVQLWSGSQSIPNASGFFIDSTRLQVLINQAIDIAGLQLQKLLSRQNKACAATYALNAVEKMFKLEESELKRADAMLDTAYQLEPRGLFLAWRAYARTFYIGENGTFDSLVLAEEAEAFARKAIEEAPSNSTALALASYVYSFLLRDYAVGHELAERSLKLNPANALGRAFLGRAKSYLGQHDEGYKLTALARKVSGPAPFQYTLDFLCGITALLSGRHDEAIRLGELVRALAPSYRPPQRYLIPLYLQLGEIEKAKEIFENLRKMEPNFSLRAMREEAYPSTGLREAGLLGFNDEDL